MWRNGEQGIDEEGEVNEDNARQDILLSPDANHNYNSSSVFLTFRQYSNAVYH